MSMQSALAWLATVAACACAEEPPAPAPANAVGDQRTPERALATLKRWLDATDRSDLVTVIDVAAENLLVSGGDPPDAPFLVGRRQVLELLAFGSSRSRPCTSEVVIATATDAVVFDYCDKRRIALRPPLERRAQYHTLLEIRFDADGKVARSVTWRDTFNHYAQLGVAYDVDARPDRPTNLNVTALGHGDPEEVANAQTARAIIDAFDRKDAAAAARHVASGYQRHSFASMEPQTYATPASYEQALREELAACEPSAFRVYNVVAAQSWIAIRYARGCRLARDYDGAPGSTGRDLYTSYFSLMRFEAGRLVESWETSSRYHDWLQIGRIGTGESPRRIREAGL